ncbi:hypothetical protein DSLASN_28400 [Desulfoluna limicola]|uniref:Uncharacterized protein n=1 Tax=Desulfoluna limicola TaxID=2810562 RepID=A0ABM7PJ66_9BACT|nr:hypothetical protein [Desulfoluna limicola]BCS97208.1 hypothetical protein DSLASN_28400 [Desulfoluna limicola]
MIGVLLPLDIYAFNRRVNMSSPYEGLSSQQARQHSGSRLIGEQWPSSQCLFINPTFPDQSNVETPAGPTESTGAGQVLFLTFNTTSIFEENKDQKTTEHKWLIAGILFVDDCGNQPVYGGGVAWLPDREYLG